MGYVIWFCLIFEEIYNNRHSKKNPLKIPKSYIRTMKHLFGKFTTNLLVSQTTEGLFPHVHVSASWLQIRSDKIWFTNPSLLGTILHHNLSPRVFMKHPLTQSCHVTPFDLLVIPQWYPHMVENHAKSLGIQSLSLDFSKNIKPIKLRKKYKKLQIVYL